MIATFLPHHQLVFKDRGATPPPIGGEEYLNVITEHGQRLLVPKRLVSTRTFKSVYGDQRIIFHEDAYLCPLDQLDCGYEAPGIRKGDVLKLDSDKKDGALKLSYRDADGEVHEGYLSQSRFDEWKAEGVLFDASVRVPRLLVNKISKLPSLTTPCGKKREEVDKKALIADLEVSAEPTKLLELLGRLSSVLGLNFKISGKAEFEHSNTIKAEYGRDGVQLEFSIIDLTIFDEDALDETNDPHEQLFVTAEILCLSYGEGATAAVVKQVYVKRSDRTVASRGFRDFYPSVTLPDPLVSQSDPFTVYLKEGSSPYLTSITGVQSYSRIFHIWSRDWDFSKAAVLMSLFNVTCPNKTVRGTNALRDCSLLLKDEDY